MNDHDPTKPLRRTDYAVQFAHKTEWRELAPEIVFGTPQPISPPGDING